MLSGTRVPAANLTAEKPVRRDFLVGILERPILIRKPKNAKVNSERSFHCSFLVRCIYIHTPSECLFVSGKSLEFESDTLDAKVNEVFPYIM